MTNPDISCFENSVDFDQLSFKLTSLEVSVDLDQLSFKLTRSRGYIFFMLNSIEHEIHYAHK